MKRKLQSEHDKLVKKVAENLNSKGYRQIKADLIGHTQPTIITWTSTGKGHIPDVSALNAKQCIFEVETSDSISDSHTEDQWKLFAAFANQHKAEFWVVIPSGFESEARSRLAQLGIEAKVWEI